MKAQFSMLPAFLALCGLAITGCSRTPAKVRTQPSTAMAAQQFFDSLDANAVLAVAATDPEGFFAGIVGKEGTVILKDTSKPGSTEIGKLGGNLDESSGQHIALKFATEGDRLYACLRGKIVCWAVPSGTLLWQKDIPLDGNLAVGKGLIVISSGEGVEALLQSDGTVHTHFLSPEKTKDNPKGLGYADWNYGLLNVAVSPDGQYVAVSGPTGGESAASRYILFSRDGKKVYEAPMGDLNDDRLHFTSSGQVCQLNDYTRMAYYEPRNPAAAHDLKIPRAVDASKGGLYLSGASGNNLMLAYIGLQRTAYVSQAGKVTQHSARETMSLGSTPTHFLMGTTHRTIDIYSQSGDYERSIDL